MRPSLPLVALGACLLSVLPACTAIVVQDVLADAPPCENAGDCAAGFGCVDDRCEVAEPSGQVPPEGTVVGPAGGDVLGPDGVELAIPQDAVSTATAFVIERESATNVALGCAEHSAFFRVSPEVDLAAAAVLVIPVEGCADCVVCAKPDDGEGAWTVLEAPPFAPAGSATALLTSTGMVMVAGVVP